MEDIGSLVVKVAMENSSFQQGIQNMNRQLKVVQSEFKNATAGLGEHGKGLDGLKAKQDMLSKSIDVQSKIVKQYQDKLKESKDTLIKNADAQGKLKEKIDNAKKSYEESKKALGDNNTKTKELKQSYEQLSSEYSENEEKLRNNTRTIDNWNIKANDAESKLKGMKNELSNATKEIDKQSNAWNKLSNKLAPIGEKFKKAGDKMSSIGRDLTTKVSAPIVALGGIAIKTAADFEQGMSNIKAVTSASGQEMKQLSDLALQVGKDTAFSASEAAKGIEELAKAGLTTSQILNGGLKGAMDLAAAGGIEIKDAAEVASTALNAFKRDNISVVEAANLLAGAANASATDVLEMKMALSQCSSVASAVGVSFKDTSTELAEFAQSGLKGSDAGTSLKTMLLNLQPKTDMQYKEFKRLGLMTYDTSKAMQYLAKNGIATAGNTFEQVDAKMRKFVSTQTHTKEGTAKFSKAYEKMTSQMGISKSAFVDANGHFKSLGEVSEILKTHTANLTDAQRLQALQTMFGTDAVRAATIMAKQGGKGFEDMYSSMAKVTAADTAAEKMNNFKGKVEQLKGSLETAGITMGNIVLPKLKELADKATNLTNKFTELSPGTQKLILKMAGIAAAAGPILWIGGKLVKGIGGIITVCSTVSGAIAVVSTGAVAATPAIGALAGAFTLLTGPVGIAIAAFAVVGLGAHAVHKALTKEVVPAVDLFANKVEYSGKITNDSMASIGQTTQMTTIKISEATKKAVGSYLELDNKAEKSLTDLYTNGTKITDKTSKGLVGQYNGMGVKIKQGLDKKNNDTYKSMDDFFKKSSVLSDSEEKTALAKLKTNNENKKKEIDGYTKQIQAIVDTASKGKRALTLDEQKQINSIQDKMRTTAIKTLSTQEVESKVLLERMKTYGNRITAEQASDVIKNAENQRKQAVDKADKQYHSTVANIIKMRDETHSITKEQADKMLIEAERQRKDSVQKANDLKTGVVDKIKAMNPEVIKQLDTQNGNIKTNWDKLTEWFANNPIKRFFKDIFEDPESSKLGEHIGSGLVKGIKESEKKVKEASESLGDTTRGAYKTRMGIRSPSRVMMELGKYTTEGLALGIKNNKGLVEKQANDLAESVLKEVSKVKDANIKLRLNVSPGTIRKNNSSMLDYGDKNKKSYQDYTKFVNKLNQDEVKTTKESLDKDYKNRVKNLDDRLRAIKSNNSKVLQAEKSKIDNQMAYYQKLEKNTKNKKSKKSYANKIANLRQYEKAHTNTAKSNQQATINSLEASKRALKNYHDKGIELLNKRSEAVKKNIETSENLFKDKINNYETAIKRLGIDTGDLNKNLRNQHAIAIIQGKKIEDLKKRYEELSQAFGTTSDESVEAKKAWQEASIELINMGNTAKETADKIKESFEKEKQDMSKCVDEISSKLKEALKERYTQEKEYQDKSVKDNLETENKKLQDKINALDETSKLYDTQNKETEENEKETEIRRQLSMHVGKNKRLELEKELKQIEKTREERKFKESIETQKNALQKEMETNKNVADRQLDGWEEYYKNKLSDANLNAESEKLIIENNQKEIVSILHSYGKDYELAGQSLGDRLVSGFKGKLYEVADLIQGVTDKISNMNVITPEALKINNINDIPKSITQLYDFNYAKTSPSTLDPNAIVKTIKDALKNINGKNFNPITIPIYLDGRQIAEASYPYTDTLQGKNLALNGRGL